VPLDTFCAVSQDAPIMNAGENQFSLIRAASITGGAAKKADSIRSKVSIVRTGTCNTCTARNM
jgi:hypothetical protein